MGISHFLKKQQVIELCCEVRKEKIFKVIRLRLKLRLLKSERKKEEESVSIGFKKGMLLLNNNIALSLPSASTRIRRQCEQRKRKTTK